MCDPHSPWQRGTVENTNRLLRQYFPRGADLLTTIETDRDLVPDELNQCPRRTPQLPDTAAVDSPSIPKEPVASRHDVVDQCSVGHGVLNNTPCCYHLIGDRTLDTLGLRSRHRAGSPPERSRVG